MEGKLMEDLLEMEVMAEQEANEFLERSEEDDTELTDLYRNFYKYALMHRWLAEEEDTRSWVYQIEADGALIAYKKALYSKNSLIETKTFH